MKNLKIFKDPLIIHHFSLNSNNSLLKDDFRKSEQIENLYFDENNLNQIKLPKNDNNIIGSLECNNKSYYMKNNFDIMENESICKSYNHNSPLKNNCYEKNMMNISDFQSDYHSHEILSKNKSNNEIFKPKRSYFDFLEKSNQQNIENKISLKNNFFLQINFKNFNSSNKLILKKVIRKLNSNFKSKNINIKKVWISNKYTSFKNIKRNRNISYDEELSMITDNNQSYFNKHFSFKKYFSGIRFNTFLKFENRENENYLNIIDNQVKIFIKKYENKSNFVKLFKSIIFNYPAKQINYLNLDFFQQLKLVSYYSTRFLNLNSILLRFGDFWPNIKIIQLYKTYSKR